MNKRIIIWLIEEDLFYLNNLKNAVSKADGMDCSHSFIKCTDLFSELKNTQFPDVLIVDISLCIKHGFKEIKKIKTITPETNIIIITLNDDEEAILNALCSGASGYILKTSPNLKIIETINEVVNGGVVISPFIAKKLISIFTKAFYPEQNYKLTIREKEILDLVVRGLTKKKIAERLFLSFYTIDTHMRSIYNKLQVSSRSDAVAKTIKEKII